MQDDSKKLYKAISKILVNARKQKGIKYTDFCYGNDIPMATYDSIIKGNAQSSFYVITRVVKALDMSFEEFGKLLDQELPPDFMSKD